VVVYIWSLYTGNSFLGAVNIFIAVTIIVLESCILCIVSQYTARAWSIQPASFLVVASCIKIKDIFVTVLATSFLMSPLKSK